MQRTVQAVDPNTSCPHLTEMFILPRAEVRVRQILPNRFSQTTGESPKRSLSGKAACQQVLQLQIVQRCATGGRAS